jgi:hypothetical protein
MVSRWATNAFDPPETLTDIYRIGGAWIKPMPNHEGGAEATFAMIEEDTKIDKKTTWKSTQSTTQCM